MTSSSAGGGGGGGGGGVSESDREWLVSDQEEELIRLLSVEHLPEVHHLHTDIICGDSSSEI